MRLVVLSRHRHLYSNRRFREIGRRRGHAVRVLDPLECTLAIDGRRPRVLYEGDEVNDADCLIPRIGAALMGYGVAVVGHFEAMGVPVLNGSLPIARARDKLLALQRLAQHGLDVPRTVLARNPAGLDQSLEMVGGPPVVLKLLQGTQGVGVILAETRAAAAATLDTLWGLGQNILIQEFIVESRGRDVRALVIGGRVVAAMRRQAAAGEWRSNLHRGGSGEVVTLDPLYQQVALEATRIIGLEVAGVDLLESREGPKVMEINASPGFEGLERVTGLNIAGAIVDRAEAIAGAADPAAAG